MERHFGAYVKRLREQLNIEPQQLACLLGEDHADFIAMESGTKAPFQDEDRLHTLAKCLQLEPHTSAWHQLFDLASNFDSVPLDVIPIARRDEIVSLLRTVDKFRLTANDVRRLQKLVEHESRTRNI